MNLRKFLFLLLIPLFMMQGGASAKPPEYRYKSHAIKISSSIFTCDGGNQPKAEQHMASFELRINPFLLACKLAEPNQDQNNWERWCYTPNEPGRHNYYLCWEAITGEVGPIKPKFARARHHVVEKEEGEEEDEEGNIGRMCGRADEPRANVEWRGIRVQIEAYKVPNKPEMIVHTEIAHSYSSKKLKLKPLRAPLRQEQEIQDAIISLFSLNLFGVGGTGMMRTSLLENSTGIEYGGKRCEYNLHNGRWMMMAVKKSGAAGEGGDNASSSSFDHLCFASLDILEFVGQQQQQPTAAAAATFPFFTLRIVADSPKCSLFRLFYGTNKLDSCAPETNVNLRQIMGDEWYFGLKEIMAEIRKVQSQCGMGPPRCWVDPNNISPITGDGHNDDVVRNGHPDDDLLYACDILLPLVEAFHWLRVDSEEKGGVLSDDKSDMEGAGSGSALSPRTALSPREGRKRCVLLWTANFKKKIRLCLLEFIILIFSFIFNH